MKVFEQGNNSETQINSQIRLTGYDPGARINSLTQLTENTTLT